MSFLPFWDDVIAVQNHGGIGRAAQFIGITQSALTRRLQRLEESVGVKIFEKAGRGVSLTPAGRRLLQYAQSAQAQWLSVRDTLRDMGTQLTTPRRIVVSPSATHEINAWITDIKSKKGLWVQVLTPVRSWQNVSEGVADEAWTLIPESTFSDLPVRYPTCQHQIIQTDVLRPYSALEKANKIPLFTLARGRGKSPPLILYSPGTLMGEAVRLRLKDSRLDLADRIHAEVSNAELVARLVGQGYGVGWLPERYAHQYSENLQPLGKKEWDIPLVLVKSSPSLTHGKR